MRKISIFIALILLPVFLVISNSAAQNEAEEKSKNWKLRSEISYTHTTGNTSIESIAGKLTGEIAGEKNRYFTEVTFLRNQDSGKLSANKIYAIARAERTFYSRLFGFAEADYLRDTFAGYEYRITAGAGLGLDILKNDIQILKILGSVKYIPEKFATDPPRTDEYSALNAAVKYAWAIRSNTRFTFDGDYLQSLEKTDKYYANAALGLEVAISMALSLGVSYKINYQNKPPAEGIKNTDSAFMSSLIVNL